MKETTEKTGSTFDFPRLLFDALAGSRMPDAALRICLIIARLTYGYYPEKTLPEGAFIRRREIAARTGLSRRTVHNWMPKLIGAGVVIQTTGPTQQGARLKLNPDPTAWGEYSTQSTPQYSAQSTPSTLHRVPLFCSSTNSPSLDSPSLSTARESDGEDLLSGELVAADGFDEFWRQYPHKDGKARAATAWANMTQEDRGGALDVAAQMADAVQRGVQRARFAKGAGRFLEECGWSDWDDGPPATWAVDPNADFLASAADAFGLVPRCAVCGETLSPDEQLVSVDIPGHGLGHPTCAAKRIPASVAG